MGRPKKNKQEQPVTAENTQRAFLPTRKSLRDENGLLKGLEYHFKPNGFVDWRKMVSTEHIRLNKENFLRKDPPVDISSITKEEVEDLKKKADDKDLIITLAGFKELALVRGYVSARTLVSDMSGGTKAHCEIDWIPNFESDFQLFTTTGNADATIENTNEKTRTYLVAMAENRAFCRAVRNALQIHPVSQDELSLEVSEEIAPVEFDSGPQSALRKKAKEAKVSFAEFQQKLIERGEYANAVAWNDFRNIPSDQATLFLSMFKELMA